MSAAPDWPLTAVMRTGETVAVPVHADPRDFARFCAGVAVIPGPGPAGLPGGCHIWTREILKGYGRFVTREHLPDLLATHMVATLAHCYAWAAHHGPLPGKEHMWRHCHDVRCADPKHLRRAVHVRHRCDETLCVNLDHLELGRAWDNAHDRGSRGRNGWRRHGVRRHGADIRPPHERAKQMRAAVIAAVEAAPHMLAAEVARVRAAGDPGAGQLALFPEPPPTRHLHLVEAR